VRVRFQLASASDLVLADKVQIQQVLLNLIRNAVEAMEGRDRRELVISTVSAADDMTEFMRALHRRLRRRDGQDRPADAADCL
jgi:C4-dicarboxylate-specific signal transduction histidine kinase